MFYLDASVVVSLFTNETTTADATAWLERHAPEELLSSEWMWTEVSSALARKVAASRLSEDDHREALHRLRFRLRPLISTLAIETVDYQAAASFCDRHASGLRAGDALHLAVTVRVAATLVTSDKRFAAGARALGHDVELVT